MSGTMAERDTRPVTIEELLVSSLAQTDALAKRLIKKELITREEFAEDCRGTDNVSEAPKSPNERRCRHRRRTMRCRLAKPNRQLMWRIWALALIISIVFVFGSTAVFARWRTFRRRTCRWPLGRAWKSLRWPRRTSWRSYRGQAWIQ